MMGKMESTESAGNEANLSGVKILFVISMISENRLRL